MSYWEIDPARAKTREPEWGSVMYVAEEKLDGWRYLMHLDGQFKRPYLTGRRISKETGFLSEKGDQVPMLWPEWKFGYTVLDGEIMPPEGADFRDIAGIMNSDVQTAQERIQVIGPPRYYVFDVLFHNGDDLRDASLFERRIVLEKLIPLLNHPLITIVPRIENTREAYEQIVQRGGEGVILKDISSPYGEGWTKVKRYSTLDVIISGFTEAKHGRTGKYVGLIGAAIVSVYNSMGELLEVGQVSGMTDELRVEMSQNRDAWIGQVIEIRAQEWAKDRLRHPRFVRARPEAKRQDCSFAKMMQDLGHVKKEEADCPDPRQLSLL